MTAVFLAGEGATELGGWANDVPCRVPSPGIVEALLRRVAPSGWSVIDATCWKDIRKYRAGHHADAETRNVLGVALRAKEASAQVLVFCRDRDRDEDRERIVKGGIERARELFQIEIVGGVPVEAIEAWTLAIYGEEKSYRYRRPRERLVELGLSTAVDAQVQIVERARLDLERLDAPSLSEWLAHARIVFSSISAFTPNAPIFLVGFMATGKTTVGRIVAARLGWTLVDLDEVIAREAGRSVQQIFQTEGEAGFRARETRALSGVSTALRTVVATGGGAACHEGNLRTMLDAGRVVALVITPEEAVRRARGGAGRPLLSGPDPVATATALLAARAPFYARAHLSVDTVGRLPQDVARDVLAWVEAAS